MESFLFIVLDRRLGSFLNPFKLKFLRIFPPSGFKGSMKEAYNIFSFFTEKGDIKENYYMLFSLTSEPRSRREDPRKLQLECVKKILFNKCSFIGNHLFIYSWTTFQSIPSYFIVYRNIWNVEESHFQELLFSVCVWIIQ